MRVPSIKRLHLKPLAAAVLAIGLLGAAEAGGSGTSLFVAPDEAQSQTDRLIIKYRSQGSAQAATRSLDARTRAASQRGLRLGLLRSTGLGSQVFSLGRPLALAEVRALAAELQADDADIEYAEPDRRLYPMLTPNDTSYSSLWGLYETTGGIRANTAWDRATGTGVVVAVLDTGIRTHSDLSGQLVAGYDMINDSAVANDGGGRDSDPADPGDWTTGQCGAASNSSWHGTHVAGTIAAAGNNSRGVIGVAFGAKVQPVRVLGTCGGYTSDIADGMIWASGGTVSGLPANATPAKVLNLSLGGSGACDATSQAAINSARSRGATVVVAAGNSNVNVSNASPANCSGVIAVAAVNRSGGKAYYSNYGTLVDVAAPGGDVRSSASNGILSTLNAGTTTPGAENYANYQGTSMATPHVAGVAALLYQTKPTATPDEIEAAIKSSARAFPASCSGCGTGIVNADAALTALTGGGGGGGGGGGTLAEVEANNSTGTAQLISAPGTVSGGLSSTTDTDYFRINLPAGKTLRATLNGGSKDYDLYIYNSNGTQIASSTQGAGLVDSAAATNTGSGTLARYVRVRYYSGGAGSYTLQLSW